MANHDGTKLISYEGDDKDKLTLGGELYKLAANVAIARNAGGVHYRSDYTQSVRLGEAISIGKHEMVMISQKVDILSIHK